MESWWHSMYQLDSSAIASFRSRNQYDQGFSLQFLGCHQLLGYSLKVLVGPRENRCLKNRCLVKRMQIVPFWAVWPIEPLEKDVEGNLACPGQNECNTVIYGQCKATHEQLHQQIYKHLHFPQHCHGQLTKPLLIALLWLLTWTHLLLHQSRNITKIPNYC